MARSTACSLCRRAPAVSCLSPLAHSSLPLSSMIVANAQLAQNTDTIISHRRECDCALDCSEDSRGATASPRTVFIPVSVTHEGLVAVACCRARRFSMEKRGKTSFLEFCTEVRNFFWPISRLFLLFYVLCSFLSIVTG